MDDPISRQAAIDILDEFQVKVENGEDFAYSWARMRMTELPSVQEPKKGRWIKLYQGNYKCSVCGDWWVDDDNGMIKEFHFCPHCGAEMEGAEDV